MAGIVRADTFRLNTIKSQDSDVTAMTIDADGRIATPARPGFAAYLTASQSFTAAGDAQTLIFTATTHNEGNCYNTTTGAFTAPITGLYFFALNPRFDGLSGSSYVRAMITKVATTDTSPWNNYDDTLSAIIGNSHATNYQTLPVSGCLYLNANDVVYARGGHVNDTAFSMHTESQFSGYFVG